MNTEMDKPTSPKPQAETGAMENGNGHDQPEHDIAALQSTIETLRAEAADLKDKYLRNAADIENARRRLERERTEIVKFGLENVVREMLPVLDSLDTALVSAQRNEDQSIHDSAILAGMQMVKKQFLAALNKHGLELVPSLNATFDPNLHQAIQRVESDEVDAEKVNQVFAEGYTLHGRLLRPAMVSVAVPSGAPKK